nr:hypothetical protein [Tanacetum cinerariifolium]
IIPAAEPNIHAVTITAAPVKVVAASTRQKRGVVIKDSEEESTAITPAETKDKGKGISRGGNWRIESSNDTIMEDVINQGRMIDELDRDEGVELMGEKEEKKKDIADDDQAEGRHAEIQAEIYQTDIDHAVKVLSMHEEESTEVQ